MMSNRLLLHVCQSVRNVLISIGKVPNALLLEHSLVVASVAVN